MTASGWAISVTTTRRPERMRRRATPVARSPPPRMRMMEGMGILNHRFMGRGHLHLRQVQVYTRMNVDFYKGMSFGCRRSNCVTWSIPAARMASRPFSRCRPTSGRRWASEPRVRRCPPISAYHFRMSGSGMRFRDGLRSPETLTSSARPRSMTGFQDGTDSVFVTGGS